MPGSLTRSLVLGALALLAIPATSGAHFKVSPKRAPAAALERVVFEIPNERPDASTRRVAVQLPDGFLSVAPGPVSGWKVRLVTEPLARPADVDGKQIKSEVKRIVLTAPTASARLGPGEAEGRFVFRMLLPDTPGKTLTFKAIQGYDSGELVRWIGPPGTPEPAALMTLTAAKPQKPREDGAAGSDQGAAKDQAGSESASPPGADSTPGDGSEDGTSALLVAAIVAGGLLLAGGVAALLRSRRRGAG
jgi:uncharacterized protein YcnI